MKNKFRLNESQLHKLIKESVKRVLKEGSADQGLYNAWTDAIEIMGAEEFLSELWNAMSHDEIYEDLEWINRQHELGLDYFKDDDDFEEDDDEEYYD